MPPSLVLSPQYYQTVYPDYDRQNPPYKYRHYLDVIRRHRPAFSSLGDMGCADGRFLEYALAHVTGLEPLRVVGADVNAAAIARAQTRLGERETRQWFVGGPQAVQGVAPLDVITACDVLEHIEALDDALATMASLLAPGGLLMAVVPVYDGPLGPVVHWLDKDPTHCHKRSRRFWREAIARHYEILDWHGVVRSLLPLGGPYLHWPTRWARGIAPAVIITAQKRV